MLHEKQIQAYQIKLKDIVVIACMLILIWLIVCLQYGIPLNIKYIMTDAAAHFDAAEEFYHKEALLLKDGKYMMPGAYSNSGILFKVLAPWIGEMNLYNVFICFDIGILLLNGMLMYCILKTKAKTKQNAILAGIVSMIYLLGYPLNSMLFGYSYLSVGIAIITAIVLVMQSWEEETIPEWIKITVLSLLCTQVFFSYYLFVPAVYGALGLYNILYFWKKHKMLWNKDMLKYGIMTLVIPMFIGLSYHIFPQMVSFVPTQLVNGMKDEGYIYRNMITNMLLLLPFAIYYLYRHEKEKKTSFITLFAIIFINYAVIVYFAMTKGIISTYFFYKLHFILWLILWILFYKGAVALEENRKSGNKIVILYMSIYVILLMISLFTSNVKINKSSDTNEKITDVMDIYGINKTLIFRTGIDFYTDEIEVLKQVKEHDISLQDNNTLILANQRQEFWIWAILKYKFKENLYYATTKQDVEKWNNKTYEYLIYFKDSYPYKQLKPILDLQEKEIIFENEKGAIIKNR